MNKNQTKNKLTKAELRVQIAQDVIKQLKSEKLKAECEIFINPDFYIDDFREDLTKSCQSKLKQSVCTVCAKGAALVAYIRRFNQVSFEELDRMMDGNLGAINNDVSKKLKGVFTINMIDEMEVLFERYDLFDVWKIGNNYTNDLINWSCVNLSDDDNERLGQIFKMIIENKGKHILIGTKKWKDYVKNLKKRNFQY